MEEQFCRAITVSSVHDVWAHFKAFIYSAMKFSLSGCILSWKYSSQGFSNTCLQTSVSVLAIVIPGYILLGMSRYS